MPAQHVENLLWRLRTRVRLVRIGWLRLFLCGIRIGRISIRLRGLRLIVRIIRRILIVILTIVLGWRGLPGLRCALCAIENWVRRRGSRARRPRMRGDGIGIALIGGGSSGLGRFAR